MLEQLSAELEQATLEVNQSESIPQLNELKVKYLGKKGVFTQYSKTLGSLSDAERPEAGQQINQAKQSLERLVQEAFTTLNMARINAQLDGEKIDVTLPGRGNDVGTLHPVNQTRDRIEAIFSHLGFDIKEGPEIEDDYHNFEALNIPKHHPARAMQDTFYCEDGMVLRTHMSPVQIRTMETSTPPIKVIAPGRVYRHDFDHTHTPMFHQVEGLYVDKNVNFSELKSILHEFLTTLFESDVKVRFRPSYFPFTEPSAEVDIACVKCAGKGCRICSNTGWLEVAGCGMVHPNVFTSVGIDPEVYTGFAFGFGYDRLTMLLHGIDDLRSFFESDLRFLKQF
jgi:phenylalanyl-tRNA synthetase alpha chain